MQVSNNLGQINKIERKQVSNITKANKSELVCTDSSQSLVNTLKFDNKKSSIPASALKIIPDTTKNSKNDENKTSLDKTLDTANKVTIGVGAVGSVITAPGEIVRAAPAVQKLFTTTVVTTAIEATISAPNGLKSKAFFTVAKTASKAGRAATSLTGLAVKLNHGPTYNIMANKVLPVANGVVSGIGVYTGIKKYNEASKKGDKVEMLKSGTQIALNVVSGVGGFVPGKGQVISGVAGIASLVSDFTIDKTSKLLVKK